MFARSSVSDTTEVTPAASVAPKSCAIRSSVRSIGAAPMPPEPPQCTCESNNPGIRYRPLRSSTDRALGQRHALVLERHARDPVVPDHDARVDDAAAEAVEHRRAAQHAHLSLRLAGLDAPRARQVAHAERRRREGRHAERGREREQDGGRAPCAESDRCLPTGTASTSARCRRRRWRASTASDPAIDDQPFAADDHARVGVDQVGRRQQAREALHAVRQARQTASRSRRGTSAERTAGWRWRARS